jgi:hypothetical protein
MAEPVALKILHGGICPGHAEMRFHEALRQGQKNRQTLRIGLQLCEIKVRLREQPLLPALAVQ